MKFKKYIPDIFKLFIELPLIRIHIELLTRSEESRMFNYLIIKLKIYKWENLIELKLSDNKRERC